jgi:hypothetical protein
VSRIPKRQRKTDWKKGVDFSFFREKKLARIIGYPITHDINDALARWTPKFTRALFKFDGSVSHTSTMFCFLEHTQNNQPHRNFEGTPVLFTCWIAGVARLRLFKIGIDRWNSSIDHIIFQSGSAGIENRHLAWPRRDRGKHLSALHIRRCEGMSYW